MQQDPERTKPPAAANGQPPAPRSLSSRLRLAVAPTVIVLIAFAAVDAFTQQHPLFAPLAVSTFLVYLNPKDGTNTIRRMAVSHLSGALIGFLTHYLFHPSYLSGGAAMVLIITLMLVFDEIHPPAIATTLSFAFQGDRVRDLLLFGLALSVAIGLTLLQRLVAKRPR